MKGGGVISSPKKGCDAERQPLSGQLGGEFSGDIKIKTKFGRLVGESKYQANGRGFSFFSPKHTKNSQLTSICSSRKVGRILFVLK